MELAETRPRRGQTTPNKRIFALLFESLFYAFALFALEKIIIENQMFPFLPLPRHALIFHAFKPFSIRTNWQLATSLLSTMGFWGFGVLGDLKTTKFSFESN